MFLKVTGVVALITLPAGVGIAATSDLVVALALGKNWVDAAPLIAVLAIYGVIQSLQSNSGAVLLALGKLRALACILAIQAAIFVPALLWGANEAGGLGAAMATLVAGTLLAPINLTQVFRAIDLRFAGFLRVVWRPVVAASIMYGVIKLAQHFWHVTSFVEQFQQALALVLLGAVVYTSAVLGLWRLASCPPGAEQYVLGKLPFTKIPRRS
jgi:O-antigen/teichoic acid export membrane protein